jgi:hypothetical protein
MGLFSSVGDYLGGYVAPDPLVRKIEVDGKTYEIRKGENCSPYMSAICYKNQESNLKGEFLLNFSDENLISRIREEIRSLKQKEAEYQNNISNDVSLLRQVCDSVGIVVDEDIQGNFKYFLSKYLKAKNIEVEFRVYKSNDSTYEIDYKGSHSFSSFLTLLNEEQAKKERLEQLRKTGKPIPKHLR